MTRAGQIISHLDEFLSDVLNVHPGYVIGGGVAALAGIHAYERRHERKHMGKAGFVPHPHSPHLMVNPRTGQTHLMHTTYS